jgi:hypothetical protein
MAKQRPPAAPGLTARRDWKPTFIEHLAGCGNVKLAADAAGISRRTAYNHRADDKDFAAQWDEAIQDAADVLEAEARRRAAEGVDEPVIHLGKLQGMWVNSKGETVADPQHAFSKTAQAATPIATQFKEATGIGMSPWPRSTDKQAMVERVRERLIHRDPESRELAPRIKVFRSCANTIAEFQSWRFKRTSKGAPPAGDDAYEDANNHACDVVCGMVALNLKHERGGVTVEDRRQR